MSLQLAFAFKAAPPARRPEPRGLRLRRPRPARARQEALPLVRENAFTARRFDLAPFDLAADIREEFEALNQLALAHRGRCDQGVE